MGLSERDYLRRQEAVRLADRTPWTTIFGIVASILGIGGLLWFARDTEVQRLLVAPSPAQLSIPPQYQRYVDAILPASDDLRALAYKKVKSCPAGDRTCIAIELYRYVQEEIGYLADPAAREYIQTPTTTLNIGAGDCEDLSILLASLLENTGIPSLLVFAQNHVYTMACGIDTKNLRSRIEARYTTRPPEVVHEDTRQLDAHMLSVINLNVRDTLTLSIGLRASTLVDWIVVPTTADVDAIRQHQSYRYFPSCSRERITELAAECTIPGNAPLIAINRTDHPVQLATRLRYEPPPIPPNLPTLTTYVVDGSSCLPLDPAIKGQAYPGQIMPFADVPAHVVAVNRAGQTFAVTTTTALGRSEIQP